MLFPHSLNSTPTRTPGTSPNFPAPVHLDWTHGCWKATSFENYYNKETARELSLSQCSHCVPQALFWLGCGRRGCGQTCAPHPHPSSQHKLFILQVPLWALLKAALSFSGILRLNSNELFNELRQLYLTFYKSSDRGLWENKPWLWRVPRITSSMSLLLNQPY